MSTTTIAQVVTVYTLTDGTIRIHETGLYLSDCKNCEAPVYCETPEDAIEYLRDTDALSVNPKWYENE